MARHRLLPNCAVVAGNAPLGCPAAAAPCPEQRSIKCLAIAFPCLCRGGLGDPGPHPPQTGAPARGSSTSRATVGQLVDAPRSQLAAPPASRRFRGGSRRRVHPQRCPVVGHVALAGGGCPPRLALRHGQQRGAEGAASGAPAGRQRDASVAPAWRRPGCATAPRLGLCLWPCLPA